MTHFKFCRLHLFVTIASITTLISSCDLKNDNNTYIEEEALSAPSNFTTAILINVFDGMQFLMLKNIIVPSMIVKTIPFQRTTSI